MDSSFGVDRFFLGFFVCDLLVWFLVYVVFVKTLLLQLEDKVQLVSSFDPVCVFWVFCVCVFFLLRWLFYWALWSQVGVGFQGCLRKRSWS
jgi:hypothetical protein